MKDKIHPRYEECTVTCGCGNSFTTRATVKELKIEICNVCHPFYKGKQKFDRHRRTELPRLDPRLVDIVLCGVCHFVQQEVGVSRHGTVGAVEDGKMAGIASHVAEEHFALVDTIEAYRVLRKHAWRRSQVRKEKGEI